MLKRIQQEGEENEEGRLGACVILAAKQSVATSFQIYSLLSTTCYLQKNGF